jgi:hypothetical protein
MSNETWLIDREMDTSKKILAAMRIIVFDFELFVGERVQKRKSSQLFRAVSSSMILGVLIPFEVPQTTEIVYGLMIRL